MLIPQNIKKIITNIEADGFEVFVVGGAVRDFLLGKTPFDYDLTTNALPDDIKNIFKNKNCFKIIETGIKHGTLTIIYQDISLEITTYRTEDKYFDSRHPDSVSFITSIDEDLQRRDFTINAICYRKEIYDPLNGMIDLNNKIIRAIGNPDKRFKEDALRIMRAIRFAAVLSFKIDKKTKISLLENKDLLQEISFERIRDEFNKIITASNPNDVITNYYNVFYVFLKEFGSVYSVELNFELLNFLPENLSLRLAGFFYIVIKNTKPFNNQNNHLKILKEVLYKLKYPLAITSNVLIIIENIQIVFELTKPFIKFQLNKFGLESLKNIVDFKIALAKSNNSDFLIYQKILQKTENIIKSNEVYNLKQLAIDGSDLLKLGFMQNERIGEILSEVLFMIIEEKISNDKDVLLNYLNEKYLK